MIYSYDVITMPTGAGRCLKKRIVWTIIVCYAMNAEFCPNWARLSLVISPIWEKGLCLPCTLMVRHCSYREVSRYGNMDSRRLTACNRMLGGRTAMLIEADYVYKYISPNTKLRWPVSANLKYKYKTTNTKSNDKHIFRNDKYKSETTNTN